ncbi:GGDEF domain-containing protein [Marinomonas sp. M1K-6]|uniref:diguanylate cyclase n=2 Tax=Marinomonas profundi TaxID=2726122 RepID=A0A847QXX1_9GAMM|nr:GGDEF domain-containing protein [Marinomonas profundi]UDV04016.1 GGDEF domain-containing protein [Marinomonas profundi]
MIFFCFFNIVLLKQLSIGILEAVFGLLNLGIFYLAYQGKTKPWHKCLLLGSITITVLYPFYLADLRAGSIYWLLLLPPLYCLLVGAKRGLFCTILLSFPVLILLFIKSDSESYFSYRSVINFVLAYFLSYAICYLYETQYDKNSQRLQEMAFRDPLTGAKNRHSLKLFFDGFNKKPLDPFQQEEEETRLLIIDIDYFKSVNDEFGHDAGDAILIEMTELLQYHTDNQHVYRIGGEEFLIVLEQYCQKQAYNFAESIRQNIENTIFRTHQQNIKITVSIGIAQLIKGQSFREFLRVADKNLYSAKNQGRNLVHYGAMSVTEVI